MRERIIFSWAQREAVWTPTVNMLKALFFQFLLHKPMKFNIQYHRDEISFLFILKTEEINLQQNNNNNEKNKGASSR